MTPEQRKQQELVYLIYFLIHARQRPTVAKAQAALRQAIGLWSLTTTDIATYWPWSQQ